MLKTIKKIFKFSGKKAKASNFFDLSSNQQKKIMKKAVRKANKDQLDLVERYEKKYGKINFEKCSEVSR